MRVTCIAGQILAVAFTASPLALAWPSWPRWLPELDSIIVRQDQSTTSPSPTTTALVASSTGGSSQATAAVKTTNLNTGGIATGTGASGGVKTSSTGSSHTLYNQVDPAGNVVMVTPAAILGTQLYKIGDKVTLGWNYTNVQGAPTAIDVLASCSKASNTWTVTQNMTYNTAGGSLTWDTGSYLQTAVQNPLLSEMYTLLIYDAESSVSATAEAGYLAPFSNFQFGLYSPKAATALADFKCPTCSGGVSDMERRAIGMVAAMSVLTVLSFTWFVTGFGFLL